MEDQSSQVPEVGSRNKGGSAVARAAYQLSGALNSLVAETSFMSWPLSGYQSNDVHFVSVLWLEGSRYDVDLCTDRA